MLQPPSWPCRIPSSLESMHKHSMAAAELIPVSSGVIALLIHRALHTPLQYAACLHTTTTVPSPPCLPSTNAAVSAVED